MCTRVFAEPVLAHRDGGSFDEDVDDGGEASLGSWRPIGAVVAAVVAGLGHEDERPRCI